MDYTPRIRHCLGPDQPLRPSKFARETRQLPMLITLGGERSPTEVDYDART